MDSSSAEVANERMLAETPEDVAVLYSWANLQGAKYRDFSASRREYRAQMRHRQAEQLREEEMRAKGEAEAAAADAERAAREAEEAARFHEKEARKRSQEHQVDGFHIEEQAKAKAQQHAAELNRIAAAERVEAARRAEAVAAAEALARREEREMAEAQASAARQAARYEESESRRKTLAGPQPSAYIPGEISDPYVAEAAPLPGRLFHQPEARGDTMQPMRHAPSREARLLIPQPDPRDKERHEVKEYWVTGTMHEDAAIAAEGTKAIERDAHASTGHVSYYYDPNPQERAEAVERYAQAAPYADRPAESPRSGVVSAADPYADRVVEVDNPEETVRDSRSSRERQDERLRTRNSSAARAGVFEPRPSAGSIYGLSGVVRTQKGSSRHEQMRPVGAGEGAPLYDPIPGSPRPESASVRRAPRSGVVESAKYLTAPSAGKEHEFTRSRPPRGYRPDEASGVHLLDQAPDSRERAGSVPAWISSEALPVARMGSALDTLKPVERTASPRPTDRQASALHRGEDWTRAMLPDKQDETRHPAEALPAMDTRGLEFRSPELKTPEPKSPETRNDFVSRDEVSREYAFREDISSPGAALQYSDVSRYEAAKHDAARAAESNHTASEPQEQHRSSVVRRVSGSTPSPVLDTLQHSRERVASRWYALKGVFDHAGQQHQPKQGASPAKSVPMIGVFSLAGGTGKTSLVATLGRALSASGEQVLLTDMTAYGLLPFYFGASELRPGVVRTFSPPPGSGDAAIALVSYETAGLENDAARKSFFKDELARKGAAMQRVVLDIPATSPWIVQRLAKLGGTIVVPVSPDMNSVISLGAVEKFFAGIVDQEGRAVQPYYLLNQFDAALPLHLDVREVMKQQLGDRLLPFVIRRSPVVSEALAEGMTVIDYAPESPAAGDYMNLAQWLRTQSSPAAAANKNVRWSER